MTSARICLAEDDPNLRKTLKAMLGRLGHTVVCDAENGQVLLESMATAEVDLVLADLDMPIVDGLTAAEEIAHTKHIPVILLSGHADAHHIVFEREPIAKFLLKPVSMQTLEAAIQDTLARARP